MTLILLVATVLAAAWCVVAALIALVWYLRSRKDRASTPPLVLRVGGIDYPAGVRLIKLDDGRRHLAAPRQRFTMDGWR